MDMDLPVVFLVLLLLFASLIFMWIRRCMPCCQEGGDEDVEAAARAEVQVQTFAVKYAYLELQTATNGFSTLSGYGAFGYVYEGTLKDGSRVAVKKLSSSAGNERDFGGEVRILGAVHHRNLVRLRGYCAEGEHRLLVYELIPNGSLDLWLFAESRVLRWEQRAQIALGSARALAYLHEEFAKRILHLDIKPQNILLDEDLNPKVADFGVADCKLLGWQMREVVSVMQSSTPGYLAPELADCSAPSSTRMDVYSLGIVFLELVTGRRAVEDSVSLRDWTLQQVELLGRNVLYAVVDASVLYSLVDARLKGEFDAEQVKRMIQIALWCVLKDSRLRPSMRDVVRMIEQRQKEILPAPLDWHGYTTALGLSTPWWNSEHS